MSRTVSLERLRHASRATVMLNRFHWFLGDEPGRGNGPLRVTLHEEEHIELIEALNDGDRAHIARELADIVYVAYGTAHAFDIDLDAALEEIHRAAMSKLDPPGGRVVREDGKILKPPGFVPPDMTEAIAG